MNANEPVASSHDSKGRRRLVQVAGLAALLVGLAGCNTMAGAGKDVSSVGHNVSRGATAAQDGIHNATGASKQ